jgi:type II secretion system protein N
MKFLKKKGLWFTVYGIFITLVFLYLLFPGELVKSRLEDSINVSGFMVKSASLHPALPLGIKLKNVTISSQALDFVLFQGELLDLQLNLLSFFRKNTYIGLTGLAYDGSFDGRVGLVSFAKVYPPVEVILNFENIDIGKYSLFKGEPGKSFTGRARGTLTYGTDESSRSASGTLTLFFKKGSYPLTEPFLGMTRIDFDRGEIQAQMKNGIFKLEKIEIFGQQINCFLKGEITPAADFRNSQLNLNGMIEILGKDKVIMKVMIGGTLATPAIRYI